MTTNGEHDKPGSAAFSAEAHVLSELKRLACSPGFIYALAHAAADDGFITFPIVLMPPPMWLPPQFGSMLSEGNHLHWVTLRLRQCANRITLPV